jgi:plastocyanin
MSNNLISYVRIAMALVSVGVIAEADFAAEWGSLKGRFIVDGTPPKLPPLKLETKDQFCIDKKPTNQSIVVGKDNGLANAVVYLRLAPGKKVVAHPDYAAKLKEPAVLDNNGCQFHPHVVLVRVGQPFIIKNSDPVGHNTKASLVANGQFNVTIAAGAQSPSPITKVETIPLPVNCNIHTWMEGHILVQDHPYMAVSGEDGTFEIKNLPAGKNEFQFWHEAAGYVKNLKLKVGATDRRGRAELAIPAGQTLDLGDLKIPASALTGS